MDKTAHRIRPIRKVEQYTMITVGIVLMAVGFYFFLIPVDLVAGGVTGIGMIIQNLLPIPISYTVFVFNMILLFLGLAVLGKRVFIRSIFGSLVFPLVLFILEFIPVFDLEQDYLIAVVFGGGLLGVGFGLVLKYGGTSGGTDIPVKILNKVFGVPISYAVYMIDGIIVLTSMILFIGSSGILKGFYALIAIIISGKAADMVVVGGQSKALQIITDFPEEIKQAIYDSVSRGVTEVSIKGGYSKVDKTMLVTVITKREYYVVRNIIARIDEAAFVYVTPATEIHGDFIESESE